MVCLCVHQLNLGIASDDNEWEILAEALYHLNVRLVDIETFAISYYTFFV